jgi:hypothetical protein
MDRWQAVPAQGNIELHQDGSDKEGDSDRESTQDWCFKGNSWKKEWAGHRHYDARNWGAAGIHPQGPNCVLYWSLGCRQEWQERSVRRFVVCGRSRDRANLRPLASWLSRFFKSDITLQLWTAL